MQQQVITLFCSFTRAWVSDKWLNYLADVEHDASLTNLAFIIDADEPLIKSQLEDFATRRKYRDFKIVMNKDHAPNEVRISVRRQRIAEMKNQSCKLIADFDGDIVLGFEDDTVLSRMKNFDALIQPLLDDARIGFVEGVQLGRWGAKLIGAWQVDDFEFPQKAWTMLPPTDETTYQDIDAGGFYGYATRKQLYVEHDYHSLADQVWGPDVNFGLWVRQRGYRCLIHWPSIMGHDDHGIIGWPDQMKLTKVEFLRLGTGIWQREDTDEASSRY